MRGHSSKKIMVKRERVFSYDFIRAVAMIFVISVHSLVVIDFTDQLSFFYFNVMQAVFFTCNGMFFMMSGKFALSKGKVDCAYYFSKFESIIIPMLIFMGIRTVYINVQTPYDNYGGYNLSATFWVI